MANPRADPNPYVSLGGPLGVSSRPNRLARVRAVLGEGRGYVLAAVAVGWLLVLGTRYVVPALLPGITAEFGVDNAAAGVAMTVVWGTYGLTQFPAGALVDRLGVRRLLVASVGLTAASMVAIGASPVYAVFLLACALYGLGSGVFGPTRGIAISKAFGEHDTTAIGATLAVGSLGAAALPAVSGVLAASLGWRLAAVVSVPLFAVTAVAMWRWLPADDPGADDPPASARGFAGDLAAAIRTRPIAVSTVAVVLVGFGFQGVVSFFPTYLVEVKELSGPTAASLFALVFVGGAAAQSVGGAVATRFGERPTLVALAAVSAVSLGALPFVEGVLPLAALAVVVGFRSGVVSINNAYTIGVLPESVQGSAWGFLRTAFFLITAGASTAVGALADVGLFDEAFLALAALTALSAVVYCWLPPRSAA